jgi:signal transduction histidine kinase
MRQTLIGRYGMALVAAGTALALRELLRPLLGNTNPYHTVWAAIVFSAWYCGLGPSIVASLFGALGVWYLFLPPYHLFAVQNRTDIFGAVDFLLLSGFIVALGEGIRRGDSKRKKAEHELRIARELAYSELDKQVKERTREVEQSNQQLRQLSARLIRIQDEERRKIARELHDSAGQYFAAVGMALEMAKKEQASPTAIRKLEEAAEITKVCTAEIRTISHLLHPPLLEELGLLPAIRWYVEGFTARSGIQVRMELA